MNRREMLVTTSTATLAAVLPGEAVANEQPVQPRKTAAMLIYPSFTVLDLVGPFQVFAMLDGLDVKLVAKSMEPVKTDSGMRMLPDYTFKDCPEDLAILFVPGGTFGTLAAMRDAELLQFLRERGPRAQYVTSVCTGSLVLGAAGLLRGYKATTHWSAKEVLPLLGAEVVDARVVHDRNRITGGGVTAGIDFGLTMAVELKGEDYARMVQLAMEYDPQPPLKAGSPKQAGAKLTAQLSSRFSPFLAAARAAAEKAKAGW